MRVGTALQAEGAATSVMEPATAALVSPSPVGSTMLLEGWLSLLLISFSVLTTRIFCSWSHWDPWCHLVGKGSPGRQGQWRLGHGPVVGGILTACPVTLGARQQPSSIPTVAALRVLQRQRHHQIHFLPHDVVPHTRPSSVGWPGKIWKLMLTCELIP